MLGEAAAGYIKARLGGKARVVLLTHDSNQYLAQRFVAIRQALKNLQGVVIVADISPLTVNKQGGYDMMKKILLAHPSIDVVLGADTVCECPEGTVTCPPSAAPCKVSAPGRACRVSCAQATQAVDCEEGTCTIDSTAEDLAAPFMA